MSERRNADPSIDFSSFDDEHVMLRRLRAPYWRFGTTANWPDEIRFSVRTILRSVSPMAVLIGQEGNVIYNDAARRVFGAHYEQSLGKPITEIFPHAAEFLKGALSACHKGRGVRFYDQPLKLFRNGKWETAWFSLSFTPILDERDNVLGAMVLCSEDSARVKTLKELRRSRKRMELALEAGSIVGTWDLEISTGEIILSSSLSQMFGLPESRQQRHARVVLTRSVHDEDRERVLSEFDRSIKAETDFRCRFRVVTTHGGLHWFVALGKPVRDQDGKMTVLSGVIIDVTEVTETSAALQESNLRFDVLAETVPQIVWSTDGKGKHDYFSSRWSEFTGIAQEDITPNTWKALVHPEDWERLNDTWQKCLGTGRPYNIDYRFRYRDGTYRWLNVQAKPLRNERGEIVRWYGTATDIEEAKQLEVQRTLLTREMDHRIKNLFALVNGLVGLTVRDHPALQPLAEPLRARLGALHEAHALVHGDASKVASLRELIHCLLQPYKTDADRIIVSGIDVRLQSSMVTAMALAFHELISNSAKYGALASRNGTLAIEVEEDDEKLLIHWHGRFAYDQHQAEARMKKSRGFGTLLLKSVIEGQLRGTFKRDFVPEGINIEITLPISIIEFDNQVRTETLDRPVCQ